MKLSIQKKYSIGILAIALIPLLIMPVVGFIFTTNVIREKVINLSLQETKRYARDFDEVMDDIIVGSNSIVFDDEVQKYLADRNQIIREPLAVTMDIENKIHRMQTTNWYIYDIETLITDLDRNIYNTNFLLPATKEEVQGSKNFDKILDSNDHFIWTNHLLDSDNNNLVLFRSIKDEFYNNLGAIGIMVKPKSNQRIVALDTVEGSTEHLFILDKSGEMVFNDQLMPLKNYSEVYDSIREDDNAVIKLNGTKVIVTKENIRLTDWSIYHVQNYQAITIDLTAYRNWNILMNAIFVVVILISSSFASKFVTKGTVELSRIMSKVSKGDLKARARVRGSDEINELSDNFNYMIDRIEALILQVEEETKQKQIKHIEALQAQINPHFLLNTLNGIKWLVVMKDHDKAEKMLIALGALLERTLGKNQSIVTLQEELQLLKYYGDIQKYRYGETFEIIINADVTLNAIFVPSLILQPIVENCILHAFNDLEEKGQILVTTYKDEEYVYLEVKDNGTGFDTSVKSSSKGIGLKNVDERLALYYDESCHIIVDTSQSGTVVTLRIRDSLEVS